ncbi:hypothetical protein ACQKNX_07540 [Lysinibacillus sp. NPDC093712]|uniref:hypothetical protein n=1 Tax=Lysinibacillus sp. NPDC093712 TaxID=3390579 RepID=UPI003D08480F
MNNLKRKSSGLEKFVKFFIAFVFILMIVMMIGQGLIVTYFIKNPDSIGSWIGGLLKGIGL